MARSASLQPESSSVIRIEKGSRARNAVMPLFLIGRLFTSGRTLRPWPARPVPLIRKCHTARQNEGHGRRSVISHLIIREFDGCRQLNPELPKAFPAIFAAAGVKTGRALDLSTPQC